MQLWSCLTWGTQFVKEGWCTSTSPTERRRGAAGLLQVVFLGPGLGLVESRLGKPGLLQQRAEAR